MGRKKVGEFSLARLRVLLARASRLLLILSFFGCGSYNSSNQDQSRINSNAYSSDMKQFAGGPITYVALGDSTGLGIGAKEGGYVVRLFKRIETKRPGSTLANLCVSGATTEDVLNEQLEEGIARQPTLITLGVGINDIGHGMSLEQFARNYDELLRRLKSTTGAIIVVTNVPDISTAPQVPQALRSEYHQRIAEFNEKLQEIASRHGAPVFDVYTFTHEYLPSHREFFSADGFHPSDKGYELWAEQMWPTLAVVIDGNAGSQP